MTVCLCGILHDAFTPACFSVYASIHLSPPELQDSIPGRADFSFQGGDFHPVRRAPLTLAHGRSHLIGLDRLGV